MTDLRIAEKALTEAICAALAKMAVRILLDNFAEENGCKQINVELS